MPIRGLQVGREEVTSIELKSNVAILNDSYLGQSPLPDDYLSFYQLSDHFSSEYYRPAAQGSTTVSRYVFTESLVYQEYQRFKFNLIDILSELGGLFNSIYLIGFAFTVSFSYNLYLSSLMRSIYHFPAKFESELSKSKKKKGKKEQQQEEAAASEALLDGDGTGGGDG